MQGVASLPYDLEEKTEIDLPNGGIMDSSRKTAKFMLDQVGKEYGRGGDTILGHLTEGETVIPVQLLEENPAIATMIRKAFDEQGESMDRYIVGNEFNMRNPVTGQPEFFGFIKKAFKKLKKAVKKVFKHIKKVVKKLAPIVLPILAPIALPMLGGVFATMGTATMVGIGSMAGSLIAGADFKDALKAGAMGALTAGVVQGGVSKFRGGTFGEGFTSSFTGAPNTSIPTQSVDVVDQGMTTAEIDALSPDVGAGVEAGGIDPAGAQTGGTLDTRLPVNPDPLQARVEVPDFQQNLSFDNVRPDGMGLDITSTTPDIGQVASAGQTAPTMADLNAQISDLGIGQAPNPANIANLDPSQLQMNPNYSGQLGDPNFNLDMNMDYLSQTNPMSGPPFGTEMADINAQIAELGIGNNTPAPDTFLGSKTLSKITPDFIENPLEATGRFTRDTYNKYISPSRTPSGYTPTDPTTPYSQVELSKSVDFYRTQGLNPKDAVAAAQKAAEAQSKIMVQTGGAGGGAGAAGATHGTVRAYAPMMALGTGAAYLGGAFEEEYEDTSPGEEAAKLVSVPTGADVYANAPAGTYAPSAQQFFGGSMLAQYGMPLDYSQQMLANRRQFYPDASLGTYGQGRPLYGAASGGAINGPGTGTSDSIPAMLSDGEFVMTADAVRGAGNGSRQAGAQRMYDMMHEFEATAGR